MIQPFPSELLPKIPDMTLRDFFASLAMQGELAAQDERHEGKGTGILIDDPEARMRFARRCFSIADAMLAAREESK